MNKLNLLFLNMCTLQTAKLRKFQFQFRKFKFQFYIIIKKRLFFDVYIIYYKLIIKKYNKH